MMIVSQMIHIHGFLIGFTIAIGYGLQQDQVDVPEHDLPYDGSTLACNAEYARSGLRQPTPTTNTNTADTRLGKSEYVPDIHEERHDVEGT